MLDFQEDDLPDRLVRARDRLRSNVCPVGAGCEATTGRPVRRPTTGRAQQALRQRNISFHIGPLVTVSQPILTPAARRALAVTSSAIAVDMESQTIAKLCRQRNIPCLAMKAVSDGLDDDLSPILGGI
ncbi:MAG: phosphorylase family protein [Nitrospira sp.]